MVELTSGDFRKMLISGAKLLEINRPLVDSLNVFPVPDGDTGTNMSLTFSMAVQELGKLNSNASVAECATAFSKGALKGARGNSGVISSQIFKGFAVVATENKNVPFTAYEFAQALKKGTEIAYSMVQKPKEGTILTVVRAMAEKAQHLARRKKAVEFLPFLEKVIAYGDEILAQTPDMLPVLKKAGVVDAGGKGLMFVMKGMYNSLAGIEIPDAPTEDKNIALNPMDAFSADDHEHINFSYCTEFFIINLRPKVTLADIDILRDFLTTIGDCVLVIGDLDLVKVHVHTNRPDLAMKNALKLGELDSVKVENMVEQNRVLNEKRESEKAEMKEYGIISVCSGKGMEAIFNDLGIDKIVEGGQTMNPSVYDILSTINEVNAKTVFILPNNKNIVLAAEQVRKLLGNSKVAYVPTTNMAQGLSALLHFDATRSMDENTVIMTKEAKETASGSITVAVRDSVVNGISIHEGDYLGILNDKIVCNGSSMEEVLQKMLTDGDYELISLYYGADVTEEQAEKLAAEVEELNDEWEVETFYGGQPLYPILLAME